MNDLSVVELRDAEARLAELVGRVEEGEEILIVRGDRPAALLSPLTDDELATECELVWEGEISVTLGAERSCEVTLYSSIG